VSISSTWPSAICSEPGGGGGGAGGGPPPPPAAARRGRVRAFVALTALLAGAGGRLGWARVYATQQEALARLFPPPGVVERRTAYLSEEQVRRVGELSGEPQEHRVVPYYVGVRDGGVVGYAFTDVHLVRTLMESVLFAVNPDGRIRSTEILSFDEPQEYLPGPRWLDQLKGRPLDEGLSLKRDIRTLSGATLSARAMTGSARRVLALFQVIVTEEKGGEPVAGAAVPSDRSASRGSGTQGDRP